MKRIIILFCTSLYPFLSIGQEYVIDYNHIIKFPTNSTNAIYRLESNRNESVYYQLQSKFVENRGSEVMQANEGAVPFVYKNFSQMMAVYNQPLINTIQLLHDKLPMQVWKLENKAMTIKAFTCKKGTTTFRGRTYTAWYTEEIPLIGGPWKFDGLPGLILAISSDDGVLNIEVTKIEKRNGLSITKFKYDGNKPISWKEYCEKFKKAIERIKKTMKADSDPDVDYTIDIGLVEEVGL